MIAFSSARSSLKCIDLIVPESTIRKLQNYMDKSTSSSDRVSSPCENNHSCKASTAPILERLKLPEPTQAKNAAAPSTKVEGKKGVKTGRKLTRQVLQNTLYQAVLVQRRQKRETQQNRRKR